MSEWRGSPNGYGAINDHDVKVLEEGLRRCHAAFGRVKMLEVGVANGYTAKGVGAFCKRMGFQLEYHGIDNECGRPHDGTLPEGGTFHLGDSTEIFESIPDGFGLLFVDACHCNNHCMLDFLNYHPKVVVGGYVLFHDTNPSPKWQGWEPSHWQGHGPKTAAFCIATQQALAKLGLTNGNRIDFSFVAENKEGDGLGMMLFKKEK